MNHHAPPTRPLLMELHPVGVDPAAIEHAVAAVCIAGGSYAARYDRETGRIVVEAVDERDFDEPYQILAEMLGRQPQHLSVSVAYREGIAATATAGNRQKDAAGACAGVTVTVEPRPVEDGVVVAGIVAEDLSESVAPHRLAMERSLRAAERPTPPHP